LQIIPQKIDSPVYRNVHEMIESINLTGYYGAERLIKASIKKFYQYCRDNNHRMDNKNFTIRYHTTIPRQVGLAGSSAIVTATIKALMNFYKVKIPLEILPSIVLSAEVDELGINAGLQDRVIQAYEGCVYMDFNKELMEKKGHGKYERINPQLLPNLYLAYKIQLGKVSGKVLNTIKQRYDAGDEFVISTLDRIAELAELGKKAILQKDYKSLNEYLNENFDQRNKIMNISANNRELVDIARSCGASAKFSGSGGTIIGLYQDDKMLTKLIVYLKKINARVIKPYIV
jgi:glucuronokinase